MGWGYDAGPVDLGGGREQDVVGDAKRRCSQGAPAHNRVLVAHGVHITSQEKWTSDPLPERSG